MFTASIRELNNDGVEYPGPNWWVRDYFGCRGAADEEQPVSHKEIASHNGMVRDRANLLCDLAESDCLLAGSLRCDAGSLRADAALLVADSERLCHKVHAGGRIARGSIMHVIARLGEIVS